MALIDATAAPSPLSRRGFRPSNRRRTRIAGGIALAAVAVGGNVLVYSSLDDRVAVLQVTHDVPAGQQITAADVRSVEVDVDPSVRAIGTDEIVAVVGRYAKVRIVAGSLIVDEALQDGPLVSSGASVVAVQVSEGGIPLGLREQSHVQLVVGDADGSVLVVGGTVIGLPAEAGAVTGTQSLSVEVPAAEAAQVAVADDVRVVLLPPDEGVAT